MSMRRRARELLKEAREGEDVFGQDNFFAQKHVWVTVGFMLGWLAYKTVEPYLYLVDAWVPFRNPLIAKVGLFLLALTFVHFLGAGISFTLRIISPVYRYIKRKQKAERAAAHAGDAEGDEDTILDD